MKIKKLIYFLFLSIALSSCTTPKENLENLEKGNVAAVISGCMIKFRERNLILKNSDATTLCEVGWGYKENNRFSGYTDINFVRPGTYKFESFNGLNLYYRRGESPSMFSNFSVKGGEVIYIGHLVADIRESNRILQAFKYFDMHQKAIDLLNKKYPSLVDKLEVRPVAITKEARFVRDMIPMLD